MERIITLIFSILIATPGFGQNVNESVDIKRLKIKGLIEKYNEYNQFNGSVLVAENGKVIYAGGIGFANAEWGVNNTTETKYLIGSLTKQFTAVLTLQLVSEGKLDLNGTVKQYLPNYPYDGGDKITIHHLLSHTSGIPRFRLNAYKENYRPLELIKRWKYERLNFEPGTRFEYSNPGYFLLGTILEEVTEKTYYEILQQNILKPLGMMHTGIDNTNAILKNRASGYVKNGLDYVNADYISMSVPFSAGNIYSTAADLLLWDNALYSRKILSKKYLDLMFEPKIKQENRNRFYSYGWFVTKYPLKSNEDSLTVIDHTGGIPGYSSRIIRIPSKKQSVILLTNVQGTELRDIAKSIAAILNNKRYPMPKKSMAEKIANLLSNKGISTATQFIAQHQKSKEFYFNEGELNRIGYRFLQLKQLEKALFVFQTNTKLFPNSGNTFDSLGEVYLKMNNKEEALKNYKRALELDSSNKNAKSIISRLENN